MLVVDLRGRSKSTGKVTGGENGTSRPEGESETVKGSDQSETTQRGGGGGGGSVEVHACFY